jgi:murein L,D-transpeptidase YcbB/YkuD
LFKTYGLESLRRQPKELKMGAPRSAAFWVAAGLMIAIAEPGRASEPAPDLALPELPAVEVSVEDVSTHPPSIRPASVWPYIAWAESPKIVVDVVRSEPPRRRVADVPAPDLPEAPVVFTVADRLAALLAARLSDAQFQLSPKLSRKDREAIAAFYAVGAFKPLWVDSEGWSAAGRSIIATLKAAEAEGLAPGDYPTPALDAKAGDAATALAEADLKLSAAAVLYARDARGARVDPGRLSRLITPTLELPSGDGVLTALASAKDPGAALAAFNPPHAGYRVLKAKLAEVRASQLGSRLEGDILANMERWRWLPAEMGKRHVWVNVPEYRLRLIRDGRAIHEARVIVGKPETPTPIFSDEMEHAIVNPSWYVPPSIFHNEFGGSAAYAASRGYQVVRTRDGGISVRQPPGERNALGFVKFMFPNQHAVYLHDTPNRKLFGAEKRAFSHGCVRLDQPFRFGEFVLGSEWTEARLRSLIGKGERTIRLPDKIPVHITYFTLTVDDKGEFRQVADLYAVNNKVRVALGLPSDGTRVAAAAPKKLIAPLRQARRTAPERAPPYRAAARAPAHYDPFYYWWVTR